MGEEYGPRQLAEYFVDQLRNKDMNKSSRKLLYEYFKATKKRPEDRWRPDLTTMSYLRDKDAAYRIEPDEAYWERVEEDLTSYLEEELGVEVDETTATPDVPDDDSDTVTEVTYAPGGRAIPTSQGGRKPSTVPDAWLTKIVHMYVGDPEDEDNQKYMLEPRYLDRDEGLEQIRSLLENGHTEPVKEIMLQSIRDNMGGVYDSHLTNISTELARYGETEIVNEMAQWAAELERPHEVGKIYEGVKKGEDAVRNDAEDD